MHGWQQDLICEGLFDVWSAVRNISAACLPPIIDNMELGDAEALFIRLSTEVTYSRGKPNVGSWRRIEGGLLGMIAIVRKFSWASSRTARSTMTQFDGTSEVFRMRFAGSDVLLKKLPVFITDGLKVCLPCSVQPTPPQRALS
jgi:hypothetical protein